MVVTIVGVSSVCYCSTLVIELELASMYEAGGPDAIQSYPPPSNDDDLEGTTCARTTRLFTFPFTLTDTVNNTSNFIIAFIWG